MSTFLFRAINIKNTRWPLMDFGSEYNEARLHNFLLENNGKLFRIEMEKTTRSISQNNLYWMYLGIIERETGNNAKNLHELYRRTLLPPKFITVMGKEIKIPMSTSELKKQEFSDYMDKIYAETNVPIPDTKKYLDEIDLAPLADE